MDFTNKKVLITGVGSGIGRTLAIKLTELGAEVYGVSKSQINLDSLKAEHPSIHTICQDLSDWDQTRGAIEALPVMDYLVNNAAMGESQPFMEVTEERLDRIFAVNVKPIVNVSQVVARKIIQAGKKGSIVNLSSQASQRALQDHTSYGMSKAAVDQITRAMATELGPLKIRTNAVNPTVTLTPMAEAHWSDPDRAGPMMARIPLQRFAAPMDVVDGILFLLSDQASMINGITMPIDGGFLAC